MSLYERSGSLLPKLYSDHLSPPSLPGQRVYPYPGTTQEPVRNSYHHSGAHPSQLAHHLQHSYIGANNAHSAALGPYRESNFSVERHGHDFSAPIERYRNRSESNEMFHSSTGPHSGSNTSTGSSSHSHSQLVRRRPSLLPHNIQTNDYNILSSNAALTSAFANQRIDRERYEFIRYGYDSRTKSGNITTASMPMGSTLVSQHNSGPTPMHMVQHGLHMNVGPHSSGQMVGPQHLSQSHLIQDVSQISVNKRPRLTIGNESRAPIHQPLLIDTRDIIEIKKEPAYTPQVEAISPTLPNEDMRQELSPLRSTKDDLLQNINKIDREILQTESQIQKLRKKHQELELVTSKPSTEKQESQDICASDSKQLSIAQLIYSDNKAKTSKAHTQFNKLGPNIELPLYNQPSDTAIYHENKRKFLLLKKKLIVYFKKRLHDKQMRERYLTDTYDKLMISWLKKLEKKETNPAKKSKDIKLREYFEKQFPELRKQREDKERFSRVGQRIRSDAELEEIMDGLQEQELEDRKMRSYAVIPPILLDTRHRRYCFINKNGIIEDPMDEYKERQMLNIWTDQEKEIFRDKYLQHPKNFGLIASYLEHKSVAECVQYYYLSKKSENYKQLLRKHVKKRTRALVKAQQQQQALAVQQQQQQRPSPSVVSKQHISDELLKTTDNSTITTTTTATATLSTTTTSTTSVVSQSEMISINTNINTNLLNETSNEVINGPTTCVSAEQSTVDRNNSKCDKISDNELSSDMIDKCCLCDSKVENYSKSRPVTVSNIDLYRKSNNDLKEGMRVCHICHFKNVRHQCPISWCKTPRRKVKRLKLLPQEWVEMSGERKELFANELSISIDTKSACSRCVLRICRRIGIRQSGGEESDPRDGSDKSSVNSWNESEIQQLKQLIKDYGKNWTTIAAEIRTKNIRECRKFYYNYKNELNLIEIFRNYIINCGKCLDYLESDSDDYWNEMSDGDSEETSSAEECNDRCNNSDTASASSPVNPKNLEDVEIMNSKAIEEKRVIGGESCCSGENNFQENFNKLQDYKCLSASQGSLKSDYDSSATMSADEGQGNGENERLSSSPAVSHPPRANSAMPVFPPSNSIYFQHQQADKHVRPASHDAAFSAVDMVSKVNHPSAASVLRTSDSGNNNNNNSVNTRQKVPPFLINPNAPSTHPSVNQSPSLMTSNVNKDEPTCVRDLIYQAIEMSLQSPLKPMRNNNVLPNEAITKLESHDLISHSSIYPLPIVKRENIDIKNESLSSHSPTGRLCFKSPDLHRPEGLAMMASYSQHISGGSPAHPTHPYVIVESDNYEVQDLSKKERRHENYSPSRNYSPSSMKEKMSLHRNEYPYGYIPPAHSNQNRVSTPLSDHNIESKESYNSGKNCDTVRHSSNSGSAYVLSERVEQHMQQQCRTSPSNRGFNKMAVNKGSPVPPPPPLIASGKSHQPYSQLSPKMYREKMVPVSGSASGGSITQGTPGVPQQTNFGYPQNRYEGLLRQIPSVVHKESGSITLGTPLTSGGNSNTPMDSIRRKSDAIESNRNELLQRSNVGLVYDDQYYRRSSPTGHLSYSPGFLQQQQHHHQQQQQLQHHQQQQQQQNSYSSSMNKTPYHKESQLSSKQIMIDFNTSKQMLTRRGSTSSEKEMPSSTPLHPQIESRSSHSDQKSSSQNRITNSYPNYPQNSTNSPSVYSDRMSHRESQHKSQLIGPSEPHLPHWSTRHPTSQSPNYNRQNVIQHWNTSNLKQSVIQAPKSNSPREYRTEVMSPQNISQSSMRGSISPQIPITSTLYTPSHDAFTTLVNAAAAQKSLAVPNVDRRSGGSHSSSSSGSRNESSIRSSHQISSDKPSVEGLEKSLMEMHGRPRSYAENDMNSDLRVNKSIEMDKLRSHENDIKAYGMSRTMMSGPEEYMYQMEQRRRLEMDPYAEIDRQRYGKSVNEHQSNVERISQPSLKFSREPFTKEQFERELRQADPMRHTIESKVKSEEMIEFNAESIRNMSLAKPPISELDNEASKLFSQSFQKDNQKANSSRGQFTAANLIDAIITHQINSSTDSMNGKNVTTSSSANTTSSSTISTTTTTTNMNDSPHPTVVDSIFGRYRNPEKAVQLQYSNREEIVTICDSPDPDKSYNATVERVPQIANTHVSDLSNKNITFGEHIATIISKNYNNDIRSQPNHAMMDSRRSCQTLEGIAATAVSNAPSDVTNSVSHSSQSPPHSSWKLRKALQQDKEAKDSDERQIIRIVQNVSPKERQMNIKEYQSPVKSSSPLSHYDVEPISPPSQPNESIQIPTTYTPMQTTWSPTSGVQSMKTNRAFYCAESHETFSNPSPIVAKQFQPSVTSSNTTPNSSRSNQSQIGLSPLDYVNNKIVEVMRTTTDKTNEFGNKRITSDICMTVKEESDSVKSVTSNTSETSHTPSVDFHIDSSNANIEKVQNQLQSNSSNSNFSAPVTISSISSTLSTSPSSSQNPINAVEGLVDDSSRLRKVRKSIDQESSDCGEAESVAKVLRTSETTTTKPINDTKDNTNESVISQSSVTVKSDDLPGNSCRIDSIQNISSSETSNSTGKSNWEVSSASHENTSNDKHSTSDSKNIYPDSPNSPGEMVIDESVTTLTSSSSPSDKSESESAQQSQISTSDLQTDKKLTISSSSEKSEVPNQSHSISSSVNELKKDAIGLNCGLSSSVDNEQTIANLNPTPQTSETVGAQPESCLPLNSSANSVSSSGTNAGIPPVVDQSVDILSNNSNSTSLTTQTPTVSTGVSSTAQIETNTAEPDIQPTTSTIQSSAISASGTPSSTTCNVIAPQYEPLSDDE